MLFAKQPSSALLTKLAALVVIAAAVIFGIRPAGGHAATTPLKTTTITVTDKTGDVDLPEWDILSGEVVQDRAAGTVKATVTLAGPAGVQPARLRVGLGYTKATGQCTVLDFNSSEDDTGNHVPANVEPIGIMDGSLHLITKTDDSATALGGPAYFVIGAMTSITGAVTKTRTDNTITLTTEPSPYFSQTGWNCALISTETTSSTGKNLIHDTAQAFAPDEVTPTPVAVAPGIGSTPAQVLDADKDGVPDASDQCPALAGAATNGCETTPAAKAVKLGTKRVVLDKLVPLTASKCPPAVKVVAVLKGKTLGKKLIGTLQHGKFCQVKGVLALKKKVGKARVTITGTGLAAFAITVAR